MNPPQAWRIYDALRADPKIIFLPEQAGFNRIRREAGDLIPGGPNAWTDAYLASFASCERITIATFDRQFDPLHGCSVLTLPVER